MDRKAGLEITQRSQIDVDRPCFYLLQLYSKGNSPFALKVGTTLDGINRLKQYDRQYYPNRYDIIHLRKFSKPGKGYGFDARIDGVGAMHIVYSFSNKFEQLVIKTLKENKVAPLYASDTLKSDEYYPPSAKKKILSAISSVEKQLNQPLVSVKARRSTRLKQNATPQRKTKPTEPKRHYQGNETGNYDRHYPPKN